jgi:FKBP-type peptidyl-prolyl cis-trans isomerase FkpA
MVGGVVVMAVLVAAGGGWFWMARQKATDGSRVGAAKGGSVQLQGTTEGKLIPLDAASKKPSSELSVTSAGSGQLSVGGSSRTTSEGEQKPDFKQFEQYKTAESTMYRELTPGQGDEAVAGKKVAVNYRGWLTIGELFDQSVSKLSPYVLVLGENRVIPGFEAGIVGMKVGEKRLVIIPPKLGYGDKSMGQIPANSVLVFEIELLRVD